MLCQDFKIMWMNRCLDQTTCILITEYLPCVTACDSMRLMCRLVGRGSVQFPLEGKPCLTMYQVLGHTRSARHNWVTTVKLSPHTGESCLSACILSSHRRLYFLLLQKHGHGCRKHFHLPLVCTEKSNIRHMSSVMS